MKSLLQLDDLYFLKIPKEISDSLYEFKVSFSQFFEIAAETKAVNFQEINMQFFIKNVLRNS